MTISFSIHIFTLSGLFVIEVSMVYIPEKGARRNPDHLAAEAGRPATEDSTPLLPVEVPEKSTVVCTPA